MLLLHMLCFLLLQKHGVLSTESLEFCCLSSTIPQHRSSKWVYLWIAVRILDLRNGHLGCWLKFHKTKSKTIKNSKNLGLAWRTSSPALQMCLCTHFCFFFWDVCEAAFSELKITESKHWWSTLKTIDDAVCSVNIQPRFDSLCKNK